MRNLKSIPDRCAALAIILFGVLAAGSLLACKKEPFVTTVNQTPYLGLPQGQNSIMSVDIARLRSKDFFRQILDSMKETGQYDELFGELTRSLGSDPLQDIDQVVMGERGAAGAGEFPLKNTVYIALGRFGDPAAKMQGLHQWLQSELLIAPPQFQESIHPGTDFKVYSLQAKSQFNERMIINLNFGFPNSQMMVFSFSPTILRETLDVIAGSAEGIRTDQAWLEMLKRPNLGAILWSTGAVTTEQRQMATMVFPTVPFNAVQQYFFSINPSDEFSMELGLVCNAIDAAQQIASGIKSGIGQAQQQLSPIKPYLPETYKLPEKVVVLPESNVVKVSLGLTEETTNLLRLEWRGFQEQMNKLNEAQKGQAGQ